MTERSKDVDLFDYITVNFDHLYLNRDEVKKGKTVVLDFDQTLTIRHWFKNKNSFPQILDKIREGIVPNENDKNTIIINFFGGKRNFKKLKHFLKELVKKNISIYISSRGIFQEIDWILMAVGLDDLISGINALKPEEYHDIPYHTKQNFPYYWHDYHNDYHNTICNLSSKVAFVSAFMRHNKTFYIDDCDEEHIDIVTCSEFKKYLDNYGFYYIEENSGIINHLDKIKKHMEQFFYNS